MEGLSFFFGVMANVLSVLVFLSPIDTFRRITRQRSTEEFESLPYVCTLLSAALWTYYGIIRPGTYLVATVNGFGTLVEIVYVTLFLIYAPPKMKAKTVVFVGIVDVGFLAIAVLVSQLALQGDLRIDSIGTICAAVSIIMYSSPLAAMKTVITTKSVEYMPFSLSFFIFSSTGIWALYGLLVQDYYVLVPNGTGFVLGTAQLVLYAIYRNCKPSTTSVDSDRLEEGWQHEPLLSPSDDKLEG
ncbi:bidirectional sugar transporter SWEET17-like [Tripterygium wilfordii]|uniref:bidirectional sugar transporter SWEET17-like n=1 Tax=Tripterygium wilfordii TaxID=458696 RepID=UPI0018F843C3|nr:bidirectional sugar transporter SWEET17-like [Tripterygium wilfordii]